MNRTKLKMRIIGFVASLVLTLTAFWIILNPQIFQKGINTAITVIVTLAICQSMVQFIFFIDVWKEKGPPWNVNVFASTIGVIFVIIFFSIWIMDHLNYNMMPHHG
jgi:cytochrome o ubiquinol oxidase operon protein cyoD